MESEPGVDTSVTVPEVIFPMQREVQHVTVSKICTGN